MAGQDLLNLSHEYTSGYPVLHPIKDMNINTFDFVETFRRLDHIEAKLSSFTCLSCPNLTEHVSVF